MWGNFLNWKIIKKVVFLLLVLLVDVEDFLHFLLAAHEDAASVVDVLRHHFEHAVHVAVDGETTG